MFNPVTYYRLARWLYLHRIPLLPRLVEILNVLVFHCYVPYTVEIGDGFEVGYWGIGVVIHPRVKIGKNVFVAQGVTIGGRNEKPEVPRIEDNVFIAAGAKVLGDIVVGEGSVIGANAVVIRSVPPRSIAVGVPARISRENIDVREYTGWPKCPPRVADEASAPESDASSGPLTRVFHLVESFNLGGSENQAVQVARRMNSGRYSVTVGCLSTEGPYLEMLQKAGIPVADFHPQGGLLSPRGFCQLLRLTHFLRCERFDVVHTHDLYSNLLGVLAAWMARIPVIISSRRDLSHWWWYTPRNRKLLRRVQSLSTFVLANSATVRDFLVREEGFDARTIRVVRNGIDAERFGKPHGNREALLPGLDPKHKLVAVVANMNVEEKGHVDLIEAARVICSVLPETRFLLIGDGRERLGLEAKAEGLGVRNNFLFLGRREDVPDLLGCCQLSVLPSWAEGFPNVILESLAAGLPVVATRIGAILEIIEDEVSGLLVPARDPQALARAILRVLRDQELADRLARAGRERALTHFSFDRTLLELRQLYEEGQRRRDATRKTMWRDRTKAGAASRLPG